ncbi:DUF3307 domain-containing protein [Methanolobus sediminis]|uniref:DUF3307 domain-containing protein n=1 Tax=Methanolobus sediminis TaxID=3072978 RepID=A0AA51YLH5_9EURY|nr:DUF3307 domain-containing protein [Methanolobus sediminis]WMW24989.1 DUF3307 domain-containing protein [Methanolobus sediminis]
MMDVAVLNVSLLARLLLSHVLADFVFQNQTMVSNRFENKWHSKWLYIHGILAGILAYVLSEAYVFIWLFLAYTISHIVIDGFKSTRKDNLTWFILDQLAHLLIIVVVWAMISGPGNIVSGISFVQLNNTGIWLLLLSYVIVIWPSGILIGKFTEPWHHDKDGEEGEGLFNAGLWIGRLERFLLLTFVLLEQYQAIGLLVTAKSIFRFTTDRKVSEYILIGTLLSFTIAVFVGIIVKWMLDMGV